MDTILGIPVTQIQCRFCDQSAEYFQTGAYEIKKESVGKEQKFCSARIIFLCKEHRLKTDIDSPIEGNVVGNIGGFFIN